MATHSSILAWKTPWTEEPFGLYSTGLQRVRHGWVTEHMHSCLTFLQGVSDNSLSGIWCPWTCKRNCIFSKEMTLLFQCFEWDSPGLTLCFLLGLFMCLFVCFFPLNAPFFLSYFLVTPCTVLSSACKVCLRLIFQCWLPVTFSLITWRGMLTCKRSLPGYQLLAPFSTLLHAGFTQKTKRFNTKTPCGREDANPQIIIILSTFWYWFARKSPFGWCFWQSSNTIICSRQHAT